MTPFVTAVFEKGFGRRHGHFTCTGHFYLFYYLKLLMKVYHAQPLVHFDPVETPYLLLKQSRSNMVDNSIREKCQTF